MKREDARAWTNANPVMDHLPGEGNGAVTGYLAGEHDVEEMERRYDERLGLETTDQ